MILFVNNNLGILFLRQEADGVIVEYYYADSKITKVTIFKSMTEELTYHDSPITVEASKDGRVTITNDKDSRVTIEYLKDGVLTKLLQLISKVF